MTWISFTLTTLLLFVYGVNSFDLECFHPDLPTSFVNVSDFGVTTANTDQTPHFLEAVAAVPQYGTLYIPSGHYYVNVFNGGISFKSDMTVILDQDAIIEAFPNNLTTYFIFEVHQVENVVISGGSLHGERNGHEQSSGGQWGHGMKISQSKNIVVKNIFIKECWGDGIYITESLPDNPTDGVTVCNVVSIRNRRQGMSIVGGKNFLVYNSEFSEQGGHSPESGIDVEPNPGQIVTDATFRNNLFTKNTRYGFLSYAGLGPVERIKVERNLVISNGAASIAIHENGANDFVVSDNVLIGNGQGLRLMRTGNSETILVTRNIIRNITDEQCRGVVLYFPEKDAAEASSDNCEIIDNEICAEPENQRICDWTWDHAFTSTQNTFCERMYCSPECNENQICHPVTNECSCSIGWEGENCNTPICYHPYCYFRDQNCAKICNELVVNDGYLCQVSMALLLSIMLVLLIGL